jgi:hypothetical protein
MGEFGELLAFGWIGSAIYSALLGQTKNRNGCLWFLVGLALGPIGLLISAVMPKKAPEEDEVEEVIEADVSERGSPRPQEND